LFKGHRLWIKEGGQWRHFASFNDSGWTSEVTPELIAIIDTELDRVDLATYLEWMASSGGGLTTDLAHWAEMGVTTARQLGEYLDGCVAREAQKANWA
jgi:hypothetical protein